MERGCSEAWKQMELFVAELAEEAFAMVRAMILVITLRSVHARTVRNWKH